jgi:hypothetical protein
VLQALAEKLSHTPEVWTTTAGQVAEWWRGRSYVDVMPSADGRSVTLSNRGSKPFSQGVLLIESPTGARRSVPLPVLQAGASMRVDADGKPVS